MTIFIVFYLVIFLLGIHFNLYANPYDELRVLEIFLVLCCAILYFLNHTNKKVNNLDFLFFIFFLTILFLNLNSSSIFEVYDLIMFLGCFIIFLCLKDINFEDEINLNLLKLLIVTSVFPGIFLIFSIIIFIFTSDFYDWQLNSSSIRIYDSVMVPIFWIAFYLKNKKIIFKIYPILIFLISLSLFVDSARSALISIIIPLIFLIFFDEKYKKITVKTGLVILISFIFYNFYNYIHDFINVNKSHLNVYRLSTSYRSDIWYLMYEKWSENVIRGVGGGYLAEIQYKYGHHMHNVYLRLLFEWGLIGCLLLLWLARKIYFLFKSDTSIILKMGVLGILIDSSFSGNWIYPSSQVICILFIAMAYPKNQQDIVSGSYLFSSKFVVLILLTFFIALVYLYISEDIFCLRCTSTDGRAAPFFWEHGGSVNLRPN